MKKLFFLLFIGVAILLIMQFPHSTISPGDLLEGHQKLNDECISCHKPLGGIANEKCIACHKVANIGNDEVGKQKKVLFHQNLTNQECSSCHTEHQGIFPEHTLSGFKHELLSLSIINNCNSCHSKPEDSLHSKVSANCNSCHQIQSWKKTIAFNHNLLLNKNNCASCHIKPTDNYHSLIKEDCNKCHSTHKWIPSTFEHSTYFKLDQNHQTTCITCHPSNKFSSYTCYGCHQHSEREIAAEHNEEGIYNLTNCVTCHKSGNKHDENNNHIEKDDD